jgi:hypothetical protein
MEEELSQCVSRALQNLDNLDFILSKDEVPSKDSLGKEMYVINS